MCFFSQCSHTNTPQHTAPLTDDSRESATSRDSRQYRTTSLDTVDLYRYYQRFVFDFSNLSKRHCRKRHATNDSAKNCRRTKRRESSTVDGRREPFCFSLLNCYSTDHVKSIVCFTMEVFDLELEPNQQDSDDCDDPFDTTVSESIHGAKT